MAGLAPDRSALPLARDSAPVSVSIPATHCRNCGAPAPGAFCPQCGQETAIALPTARQFLKEAAGRYVALDGRTWRTLAALLFRPGFLTREYLAGRRRRYIRPARLFLVLSIAMFALFRLVVDVPLLIDSDAIQLDQGVQAAPESPGAAAIAIDNDGNLVVSGPQGPLTDALKARVARFNSLSRSAKFEQLIYGAMRYGPYAMVVLLPAFALILKLLYLGRRRAHPARPRRYAEHLVFAAHDLSFLFLIVMLGIIVPWAWLESVLGAWVVAYGLWAMKAVYGGRWIGVVARAFCLAVSYFVLFGLVTAGLLLTAILLR